MLLRAICSSDVLLKSYYEDRARFTIKFFGNKDVSLSELKSWQQRYPIVFPWDINYNTLRLNYNLNRQYFPIMIVMCRSKEDVQWTLKEALKSDVKFSIRASGHDWTCSSLSNGIVIDVSGINYIKIDIVVDLPAAPRRRSPREVMIAAVERLSPRESTSYNSTGTITVGAGCTVGQIVNTLSEFGYLLPAGLCQGVSLCGHTLGGGFGFLERAYGLTCDSMISTQVVLANSEIVTASESEHHDLFWALKGGGGSSLGINTEFTFKIYKLSKIILYQIWLYRNDLVKVLKTWQNWAPLADNRLSSEISIISGDKDKSILVSGQYCGGSKSKLKELLKVFDKFESDAKVWKAGYKEASIHYASIAPSSFCSYHNLFSINKLSNDMLWILIDFIEKTPPGITVKLSALQGQVACVNKEDTAFAWREALFWILISCERDTQNETISLTRYVQRIYDKFLYNTSDSTERAYVNYKDSELTDYPIAYWGDNLERLIVVKRKYDPLGIFKSDHGIPVE